MSRSSRSKTSREDTSRGASDAPRDADVDAAVEPGSGYSSIYELANVTGVSPSTVSRVLNQRGRISAETRRRVLSAARAAGFRPRASARRKTAAIVLDRMRYAGCGGFLASMLSHLVAAMARHEIVAEIYTEDNVDQLGTRFVDGVLALTWDRHSIELLRGIGDLPVVLINRADIAGVSVAMTDHEEAGRYAAEHFLDRGHRKLGVVAEEQDWGCESRLSGMAETIARRGLDPAQSMVTTYTNHHSLEQRLSEILSHDVTGIFLAGEDLTFPAAHALMARFGKQIGNDLSIIGMENEQVAQYPIVPLTALAQPMSDLTDAALELLLDHIDRPTHETRLRVLHNRLIDRGSVAVLADQS